ncbi:MAG: NADH-quinone oxidoreductase subunit J [Opitutales bacterium]|nr:NADH-quinone oxidoreductase subunit J [Opitutales bacterium]
MENIVYGIFCAMGVGGALGLLLNRGYINAVMSMLVSMLGMSGLLFLMKAFFLAFVMLVVYAGAVMVLFVFTVMLAGESRDNSPLKNRAGVVLLWLLMGLSASYFILNCPDLQVALEGGVSALSVSKLYGLSLFTKFMLLFEIAGAVLLVAMVAIIAIAKEPSPERPKREML